MRFNEIEPLDSPPPPVVTTRRKPEPAPEEPFVDSGLKAVPGSFAKLSDVLEKKKPEKAPEPQKAAKPEPPAASQPPPPPPPVQAPASPLADVSAWIAQGAAMLSKLGESKAGLDREISSLEEESLRIQMEIEEKQKERGRIDQMIEALSKIQSAVSS